MNLLASLLAFAVAGSLIGFGWACRVFYEKLHPPAPVILLPRAKAHPSRGRRVYRPDHRAPLRVVDGLLDKPKPFFFDQDEGA